MGPRELTQLPTIDFAQRERIKVFHDDDRGLHRWVARCGGYVLTEQAAGHYILHDGECSHLARQRGRPITGIPVRWAQKRQPLVAWVARETGRKPVICRRVFS